MKRIMIKAAMCATLLWGVTITANAQLQEAAKAPYWVVETNTHTKDKTIVRFYNQQHQIVYEEELPGVHLDATRNKTKRMLNKALQGVVNRNILASQYFKGYTSKKRMAVI